MADLDYETVEAWDDDGNRHVTRILAHQPPTTDTTMIPTSELDRLRTEIAHLRAGESEQPPAEGVQLTPAEWVHRWNRATGEERLEAAARIMDGAVAARRCELADHEGELTSLRRKLVELRDANARERALHSESPHRPGYCYCANPCPCPTIRTLDGQEPDRG